MKNFFIIMTMLLLVVFATHYSLKPDIIDDNIDIVYELKNDTDAKKNIQLQLNINNIERIDFDENNFYHVYIFLPHTIESTMMNYPDSQDNDYHIGMDYRTYDIAVDTLKEQNVNIVDKSKSSTVDGFFYYGKKSSVELNYYYIPNADNNEKGYIVFSYYGKKLWKDLSWAKVYPITLQ
ncbi:hypothetical protein [Lysinibacillus sp. 54212]|uniref:hypothetical protein n=1 Tax=Lysinibacillus sp. 54212 TaxID=3119829 RepID=UPI002FC6E602